MYELGEAVQTDRQTESRGDKKQPTILSGHECDGKRGRLIAAPDRVNLLERGELDSANAASGLV